jgi:signal transduction histidine kinase
MLLTLLMFALFLLVLLGFYVFIAAPHSRAHATFALFVAFLALWVAKDIALWGFPTRDGSIELWAQASFLLPLLLQYSLVTFAWVFPEDAPIALRRALLWFAPGAIFAILALCGFVWRDARIENGAFRIELTALTYAYGVYVYLMFIYGTGLLWRKHRQYRGTLWGQQLAAILCALFVTGALNTLANIILPLAGNYALLPLGSIFIVPGVLIYAYAISNFRLFSLQSALDQFRLFPIAYKVALSIASVAVSSFVLLQIPIVWWSFAQDLSADALAWRRYLVFSVMTALVPNLVLVALIVRTISRPVRRLTEAAVRVAGGDYGAQVNLKSNDEVGLLARSFDSMSSKMRDDIEHLRQLNEHLVRTEKLAAAGTLAAGVAHEVNNPLASISSLIQILQARESLDAETREMLGLAQSQVTRITHVLRDMMDFARARPAHRQSVDLAAVVAASLRLATFDAEFKRLKVTTEFEESVPQVFGDADQLQQVVLNILLNARDAIDGDGRIHIRTRYDATQQELTLAIEDDGSGIAPEYLAQVFDPFFTTKPAGRGTGLGLAVCYGIISAHNGRIEITSAPTRGTIVRISLPTQSAPAPKKIEAQAV